MLLAMIFTWVTQSATKKNALIIVGGALVFMLLPWFSRIVKTEVPEDRADKAIPWTWNWQEVTLSFKEAACSLPLSNCAWRPFHRCCLSFFFCNALVCIFSTLMFYPGHLARKLEIGFTPVERRNRWRELAKILNEQGRGAVKTPDKWRKTWSDWKGSVKLKAGVRGSKQFPDGTRPRLNELEEKLLKILGKELPPASTVEKAPAAQSEAAKGPEPSPAPTFVLQNGPPSSQTLYLVNAVNSVQTLPILCTTDCPPGAVASSSATPVSSTATVQTAATSILRPIKSPDAILGDTGHAAAEIPTVDQQYLQQLIKTEAPDVVDENEVPGSYLSNLVCSIDASTQTERKRKHAQDGDSPSLADVVKKMMESKQQELELQREQTVHMARLAEAAERFAAAFERIAEKF